MGTSDGGFRLRRRNDPRGGRSRRDRLRRQESDTSRRAIGQDRSACIARNRTGEISTRKPTRRGRRNAGRLLILSSSIQKADEHGGFDSAVMMIRAPGDRSRTSARSPQSAVVRARTVSFGKTPLRRFRFRVAAVAHPWRILADDRYTHICRVYSRCQYSRHGADSCKRIDQRQARFRIISPAQMRG